MQSKVFKDSALNLRRELPICKIPPIAYCLPLLPIAYRGFSEQTTTPFYAL
jgi:hypothetical protein